MGGANSSWLSDRGAPSKEGNKECHEKKVCFVTKVQEKSFFHRPFQMQSKSTLTCYFFSASVFQSNETKNHGRAEKRKLVAIFSAQKWRKGKLRPLVFPLQSFSFLHTTFARNPSESGKRAWISLLFSESREFFGVKKEKNKSYDPVSTPL